MKRPAPFSVFLGLLYLAAIVVVVGFLVAGWRYYSLSLELRPRAELHALFKPGGNVGHSLGIAGSFCLVTLFLYSARKRELWGIRAGRLRRWLDLHIWLGLTGPALITLHSAFKFGGIVSVSYFSMMAVMLSGVFGRYVYTQIPRNRAGAALSLREIDALIEPMGEILAGYPDLPEGLTAFLDPEDRPAGQARSWFGALGSSLVNDLVRPWRVRRLARRFRTLHPEIAPDTVEEIVRLAARREAIRRRRDRLAVMTAVFHYWHVIHKPFAWIMILVMVVHIATVVAMGYTWVF